ncbi:conserved exported protein of unknown function [Nitrosotalea devaniterrae]|uniref:Uncharacterized protein n=1 Tax=Nitrosotalea devaniterrae TaxID=1078905 RepID=A0A128A3M3_9ARCH|nr:conserved exported protein of unknown function [Candidatus Nitrosotalea devanaterra]
MLNRQLKWILAIVVIGFIASVVSYKMELSNTCPTRQLSIASDIQKYDKTLNPQFCDALNSKISQFNDMCKSNIEELDCG